MKGIKAVLFDLDGTIIDTKEMWAQATQQMLEARNIAYDQWIKKIIHNQVHGLTPLQANAWLKDYFGFAENVGVLAQEKKQRAYALMQGSIRFIEGFMPFFQQVKRNGLQTAIVTNCPQEFVALADQEIKLSRLFGELMFTPE